MKNRVRVVSTENLVRNAEVAILNDGDEWVDVRTCVTGIGWNIKVGEVSRIHLDILPAEVRIEGVFDDATLEAFADVLVERGWVVSPPEEAAA